MVPTRPVRSSDVGPRPLCILAIRSARCSGVIFAHDAFSAFLSALLRGLAARLALTHAWASTIDGRTCALATCLARSGSSKCTGSRTCSASTSGEFDGGNGYRRVRLGRALRLLPCPEDHRATRGSALLLVQARGRRETKRTHFGASPERGPRSPERECPNPRTTRCLSGRRPASCATLPLRHAAGVIFAYDASRA
jgi:hypothetical protein